MTLESKNIVLLKLLFFVVFVFFSSTNASTVTSRPFWLSKLRCRRILSQFSSFCMLVTCTLEPLCSLWLSPHFTEGHRVQCESLFSCTLFCWGDTSGPGFPCSFKQVCLHLCFLDLVLWTHDSWFHCALHVSVVCKFWTSLLKNKKKNILCGRNAFLFTAYVFTANKTWQPYMFLQIAEHVNNCSTERHHVVDNCGWMHAFG